MTPTPHTRDHNAGRDRKFWITARIGTANDARIKLTPEQRTQIKALHADGIAIREIARQYAKYCSRSTIQDIIFPERKEKKAQRSKDNENWKNYADKETRNKAQRKHRAKVKKLHAQGKIN